MWHRQTLPLFRKQATYTHGVVLPQPVTAGKVRSVKALSLLENSVPPHAIPFLACDVLMRDTLPTSTPVGYEFATATSTGVAAGKLSDVKAPFSHPFRERGVPPHASSLLCM